MSADEALPDTTTDAEQDDQFETLGRRAGAALRGSAGSDALDRITRRGKRQRLNRVAAGAAGVALATALAIGVSLQSDRGEQKVVATVPPSTTTIPGPVSTTVLATTTIELVLPTTSPAIELEPVTVESVAAPVVTDIDRSRYPGAVGPTSMVRLIGDPSGYGNLRDTGFASDGQTIFVDMWGPTVQFDPFTLDLRPTAHVSRSPEVAHTTGNWGEVISPRGDRAIVEGDADGPRTLVDPRDGRIIRSFPAARGGHFADFSRDGAVLAVVTTPAHGEGRVEVLDARSGEHLYDVETYDYWLSSVRFSPDAKTFATYGDSPVRIWDVATGDQIAAFGDPLVWMNHVEFSPDGRTLLAQQNDPPADVQVFDTATGQLRFRFDADGSQARFIADGARILVSRVFASTWTASVIDATSGALVTTLQAPSSPSSPPLGLRPTAIELTVDGALVIAPAEARTVGVWDLITGERIASLLGHQGEVMVGGLSPDGQTILTADDLGYVALWEVPQR